MGSLPHALSRLLLWIKKQVISKEDLEVVINLETHYEKHNERWRVNHGDSEDSIMDDTLAIAHCVNQAVRATVDLTTTRKLFSMVGVRESIWECERADNFLAAHDERWRR